MAAEHESTERAAEEISQLLYHLQVLMLATRHHARRRLRPPLRTSRIPMLRIAVPNKGSLSEPAAEMLREAATAAARHARAGRLPTPRTTSSSSSCARATSPSTSARARSTSASPAATCCSTRGSAADEVMALGFGALDLPVRRHAGQRGRRVADIAGQARRHVVPGPGRAAPGRRTASPPTVVRSTAPSRPPSRLGVADAIADVVETGDDPARSRASRSSASRSCSPRRS